MADEHNIFDWQSSALWKDENFDVASYRATGVTPPDVITIPGTSINTVSFDGGTTIEDVHVCKELNHDYKADTPIAFHVHWYPTTTASGNVKWQLQYYITSQRLTTVVSGLSSITQASDGVAWKMQTANFPDIDLGSISSIGCQIHFRFFRNPTEDTYPHEAAVATVGYHYQTDSRGSSQRSSK